MLRGGARSALIDVVFSNTHSIVAGLLSCLMVGLVTEWRWPDRGALAWTAAYVLVMAARISINIAHKRFGQRGSNPDMWARLYGAGAILAAVMLGCVAGAAVAFDLPTTLLIALASVGTAGGIAGRTAALPRLARLQVFLLILPIAFGGFWSPEPSNKMLLLAAIGYGAALFSFIRVGYDEISTLIVARIESAALSRHDFLTGIPNRRHFEEELANFWPAGEAATEPMALLMIDIDHFKNYNHLYGRPAGDACLRQIAIALRDEIGSRNLIVRHGGDEFALLLPGRAFGEAVAIANALCRLVGALAIEQAMRADDLEVVTISVGVGVSADCASAAQLIEQADRALYRAKRKGGNRVYPQLAVVSPSGRVAQGGA